MNRILRWVSLLLPAMAFGQDSLPEAPAQRHRLTIEADGLFDSNVLHNDLVTGLYRGGVLGTGVLERNADALGNANRAGYDLGARATYAWGDSLFGHAAWRPRVGLSYRSVLGMRFSSDAYALSFFGNTAFTDRQAHIGPSAFSQVNYQTLRIGAENTATGSFIELALVHGWSLNNGDLRRADLYTAPDGRYLELALDGSYRRSDGRGSMRGLGAAINLEWRRKLELPCCDAVFALALSDLGFLAWGASSRSISKDSTIHYDGITVTDILDLDGLLVNNASMQDSLGLAYAEGAFLTALPATIRGSMAFGKLKRPYTGPAQRAYEIELDQAYLPGYVPHGSLARNFVLGPRWAATVGAGYGGFGGARFMAGVEGCAGAHVAWRAGTPNIVGLCSGQAQGKALAVAVEVAW